jgi:antitoxin component YwqK of YwqJK toxin-antitoxin module
MRGKLFVVCGMFALLSCSDTGKTEIVETYSSGETKVQKTVLRGSDSSYLHEELYESGKVKIAGEMHDNKRHGQWKAYFEDGKVWSIGDYINGERHGVSKVFTPEGIPMMSGFFKNGKVDSTWVTFTPTGDTMQVTLYRDGQLVQSFDKTSGAPIR